MAAAAGDTHEIIIDKAPESDLKTLFPKLSLFYEAAPPQARAAYARPRPYDRRAAKLPNQIAIRYRSLSDRVLRAGQGAGLLTDVERSCYRSRGDSRAKLKLIR